MQERQKFDTRNETSCYDFHMANSLLALGGKNGLALYQWPDLKKPSGQVSAINCSDVIISPDGQLIALSLE
jgi:hypothetical protein